MGLFAVLSPQAPPAFSVDLCHINLWQLPGLGRQIFVWDVGLQLTAPPAADLESVRLALPFDADVSHAADLADVMRNQQVASLVFGSNATVVGQQLITGAGTFDLHPIRVPGIKVLKDLSSKELTVCEVPFIDPIQAGQQKYIRVRFPIRNLGRVWTWRRFGPLRGGALIDLRVNEVREAVSAGIQKEIQGRVLPISALYVFIIAPWQLREVLEHPPFRYVRILEGRAWERYLRWSTGVPRPAKLLIYSWEWKQIIDSNKPARAFLRLTADRPGPSGQTYFALLLAVFVLSVGADSLVNHWSGWPAWSVNWAIQFGVPTTVVGVVVLFASLLALLRNLPMIRYVVRPVAWGWSTLEIGMFRRHSD
jgi:hypothetical protein